MFNLRCAKHAVIIFTMWKSPLRQAILDSACVGCVPDMKHEAYALLTNARGVSSPGLRVSLASIRMHDRVRPVVLMLLKSNRSDTTAIPPALRSLARTFDGQIIRVNPLNAWTLPNVACRDRRNKALHFLNVLLNATLTDEASLSAVRTDLQMWSVRGKWSPRQKAAFYDSCMPRLKRLLDGGYDHLIGSDYSRQAYLAAVRPAQQLQMFSKFRVWQLHKRNFTRVLYLDTDVLVARSLEELWSTTFTPTQVMAASPALLSTYGSMTRQPSCSRFLGQLGRSKSSVGPCVSACPRNRPLSLVLRPRAPIRPTVTVPSRDTCPHPADGHRSLA